MNGYAGKILRLNLTARSVSTIDTKDYEGWVGGHGMGSAIFWDLVPDKKISGFDERNVVTIMTSPLTGTLAPGGASRTEMQGIGVQSSPIGWFTRSNLGGRFGAMLKYAGWDGVVIEGKADKPVWVDIRDSEVTIRDAKGLWGKDTRETQKKIWREVSGDSGGWSEPGGSAALGRTTQKPAVMAIGPAGENLARIAAVIHDAGNAAGQGGFGAVWGAKNLKAISVIGTGSIEIADPEALLEARAWAKKNYSFDLNDPDSLKESLISGQRSLGSFSASPLPVVFWKRPKNSRPQACVGCPSGCRSRYESGLGNESGCGETAFYAGPDAKRQSGLMFKAITSLLESAGQYNLASALGLLIGKQSQTAFKATDLVQKYGINAFEFMVGLPYLRALHKKGVLGPGKEIDCDLPFDKIGEFEFIDKLVKMVAFRQGIGDDIAEGFYRAARRWGRLDKDLKSGLLTYSYWGLPDHYDPRFQVEWGYGSVLGDRDINEHGFNMLFWIPTANFILGKKPPVKAHELVKIFSEKMEPYQDDPEMLDYSDENIYSEHMAKLVTWHRNYTRFWKQSVLYCDFLFPDFINLKGPDKRGFVGEGEQKFLNAVTGKSFAFVDGIELGNKIWNLDNAIWTLQGRHRDMVHFADYIHDKKFNGPAFLPGRKNGKWKYMNVGARKIDREKFEEWKTRFYKLQGWDRASGWPTRKTLESLNLKKVADELEKAKRLGKD